MEFVHRPYQKEETIAAVATPPGEGGVAIIRISGKEALDVAAKIFSGPVKQYKTHTAHVGTIVEEGKVVDEVLLLVMLGSRSYTGEDTVEIHCHGGSLITKRVLQVVLNAGAKAAGPGAFTFKAFMNGKLDLAQAEAVQELIAAQSDLALAMAEQQLKGALSHKIISFQKEFSDIAAILEAWVDFPEEGLEFASLSEILSLLQTLREKMQRLASSFHEGRILKEGFSLCLVGPPNVGKSSLMNALLKQERAIVTDIAGTTRDLLEEKILLGNLHFHLTDTAGIRDTQECIEQEGIRRSKEALHEADLVLLVLDATSQVGSAEEELIATVLKKRAILLWNKIDLPHTQNLHSFGFEHVLHISAKEQLGLQSLAETIQSVIWKNGAPCKQEVVITSARHRQALIAAINSCDKLILGLQEGVSPEFLASDMREILNELGTIIGTNVTEDILNAIFSKFCVGK